MNQVSACITGFNFRFSCDYPDGFENATDLTPRPGRPGPFVNTIESVLKEKGYLRVTLHLLRAVVDATTLPNELQEDDDADGSLMGCLVGPVVEETTMQEKLTLDGIRCGCPEDGYDDDLIGSLFMRGFLTRSDTEKDRRGRALLKVTHRGLCAMNGMAFRVED